VAAEKPSVLLVTERGDLASDLVVLGLREAGERFYRLNVDTLPEEPTLAWAPGGNLRLRTGSREVDLSGVQSAWYRRPGAAPSGSGPKPDAHAFAHREFEAFLAGTWAAAGWRWMNPPAAVAQAEAKVLQLELAARVGLETPRTLAGNDPTTIRALLAELGELVAKPLAGAGLTLDGERFGLFTTLVCTLDDVEPEALRAAPCIFQERIARGTDVRATVVDDEIFAAAIDVPHEHADAVDWRSVPADALGYRPFALSPSPRRSWAALRRL